MTLENLAKILDKTGYPVAFRNFPKDEPHKPPFICYILTDPTVMGADNKVYASYDGVQVELYTREKDVGAESIVENVLDGAELFYSKEEGYIENENMYMVTYRFDLA